jgi:hypothetical protein
MPAQASSGSECWTASRAGKTNLDSVQKKHKRDRETVRSRAGPGQAASVGDPMTPALVRGCGSAAVDAADHSMSS